MNVDSIVHSLEAWAAVAAGELARQPWALPAITLVVGLLLVGLAVGARRRARAAAATQRERLGEQVRLLLASGAGYGEVARRTGLPRDALGLLLHVAPHAAARQNSPAAAASAARRGDRRAGARLAAGAERMMSQRVAENARDVRRGARALPLDAAHTRRGTEAA